MSQAKFFFSEFYQITRKFGSNWPIGYIDEQYEKKNHQQNSFIFEFNVCIPNLVEIAALGEKLKMFNMYNILSG